jgi:hypothetical protein
MIYFDERDISRRYAVEVADGEVRWHRDEAGFAQRMVFTVAGDGTRLDARGTMSRDGGPWEDDSQLTYERLDSQTHDSMQSGPAQASPHPSEQTGARRAA